MSIHEKVLHGVTPIGELYYPENGKAARYEMIEFLAANGKRGVTNEVLAISVEQWCSPEPRRCKGYRANAGPLLPWARAAWEEANYALKDGLDDVDTRDTLLGIIDHLTTRINSPDGCAKCALHWDEVLEQYPVPDVIDLDTARHWLVDAHNESREGKMPTPFMAVAVKFNWNTL